MTMNLLIKFPDASESFTNGVEFGRLLQQMQQGDEQIMNCGFPVHIKNKALIETTCKTYGYIASFGQEYFNEWIEFIGIKKTFTDN